MTPEEIAAVQAILAGTKWKSLDEGRYNKVYLSEKILTIKGYSCLWVLKIPHKLDDPVNMAMSASERAVQKWNRLNPRYQAIQIERHWIAPYLGFTPASDAQISTKLIDIYRRERMIITDACSVKKFLVYRGEVVCIGVARALRRHSIASDNYLDTSGSYSKLLDYLNRWTFEGMPLTASVIRTLLYLEQHLAPEEIKDEYLKPNVLAKLRIVRRSGKALHVEIIKRLLEILDLDTADEVLDDYLIEFLCAGSIFSPAVEGENHAIHIAAKHGLVGLVTALIAYNPALAHAKGNFNQSPLMWAASGGHNTIVGLLIAQHVDINLPIFLPKSHVQYWDLHHCTPLDGAILGNHLEVSLTLRNAGAISHLESGMAASCAVERGTERVAPITPHNCRGSNYMFNPAPVVSEVKAHVLRQSG